MTLHMHRAERADTLAAALAGAAVQRRWTTCSRRRWSRSPPAASNAGSPNGCRITSVAGAAGPTASAPPSGSRRRPR